jgi:DNA-binding HxlR family transcriptional regulator
MSPRPRSTGAVRRPPVAPPTPADAALEQAAEVMGDRWSLLVVARLLHGPRRFGELLDELDGLAPNILSRRLARLEAEGLVVGEPYSTRPVRHAYRLTASGEALVDALRMLAGWAAGRTGSDDPGVPRHGACGAALAARWYCPTCARLVDAPHVPHASAEAGAGAAGGPAPGDGLVWL